MRATLIADGGRRAGFGHVSRCLSILRALEKRGIRADFFVDGGAERGILDGVRVQECDFHSSESPLWESLRCSRLAIVDSYRAPFSFYRRVLSRVGPAGLAAFFDDSRRLSYPPCVVVNAALGAAHLKYPAAAGTRYLLGPRYFPLRTEFENVSPKRIRAQVRRILVTLGGTENTALINRILRRLGPKYEVTVISPKRPVSPREMKRAMTGADVCVSACGQTLYELARCGVPTIGVGLADNQALNIEGASAAGFMKFAGWRGAPDLVVKIEAILGALDAVTLRRMAARGSRCIDGQGARRIVQALVERLEAASSDATRKTAKISSRK